LSIKRNLNKRSYELLDFGNNLQFVFKESSELLDYDKKYNDLEIVFKGSNYEFEGSCLKKTSLSLLYLDINVGCNKMVSVNRLIEWLVNI
jgi:hypothetical protein